MATAASPDVSASGRLAQQRRVQGCRHALSKRNWQQHLQPLAVHMVDRRPVRARSMTGAGVTHIDVSVLLQALTRLAAARPWVRLPDRCRRRSGHILTML